MEDYIIEDKLSDLRDLIQDLQYRTEDLESEIKKLKNQ